MTADPSPAPSAALLQRRIVLGLLAGIVVYAALALYGDLGAMGAALAGFELALLPAVMGLSFANYLVRFPRWERYRALLGIRLARGTSFLVYLSGLALTVTPGKMGEVFKSWLVRELTGTPIHHSAPIVLAERFTDLLGFLVLIALGGLATAPEHAWVFWATLGASGVALLLASSRSAAELACRVLERLPLLRGLAPRLRGAFESARVLLAPRELLLPTAAATVGWGLEGLGFWLIARELAPPGLELSFAVYAFALSAVAGAVLVVFPGGLGVTEGLLAGLLGARYSALGMAAGASRGAAVAATMLLRLCTLWFAVAVGLVALAAFRRRHPRRPAAEPMAAHPPAP